MNRFQGEKEMPFETLDGPKTTHRPWQMCGDENGRISEALHRKW